MTGKFKVISYKGLFDYIAENHLDKRDIFLKAGVTRRQENLLEKNLPVEMDVVIRLSDYLQIPVEKVFHVYELLNPTFTLTEYFSNPSYWALLSSIPIWMVLMEFQGIKEKKDPLITEIYRISSIEEIMVRTKQLFDVRGDLEECGNWEIEGPMLVPINIDPLEYNFFEFLNRVSTMNSHMPMEYAIDFAKRTETTAPKTSVEEVRYAIYYTIKEPGRKDEEK